MTSNTCIQTKTKAAFVPESSIDSHYRYYCSSVAQTEVKILYKVFHSENWTLFYLKMSHTAVEIIEMEQAKQYITVDKTY